MKKITIKEYFDSISYDYEKDTDSLKDILRLTKTRVNEGMERFAFVRGMEQTFLMKSIASNINASNQRKKLSLKGLKSVRYATLPEKKFPDQKKEEAISKAAAKKSFLYIYLSIKVIREEVSKRLPPFF